MRNTIIAIVLTLMMGAAEASAQNRIDKMLEHISGSGINTFTSVVERDPSTRKVTKVVKMLKTTSMNVEVFRDAFKAEAHTGTFQEILSGNQVTMVLTVVQKNTTRVYMLTYDKRMKGFDASVTAIVKFK